jgi:hypothetical protein
MQVGGEEHVAGRARAISSITRKPSRVTPGSGHRSASVRDESIQWRAITDNGLKGCGSAGRRHIRFSNCATTTSCSGSGRVRSNVAGCVRTISASQTRGSRNR